MQLFLLWPAFESSVLMKLALLCEVWMYRPFDSGISFGNFHILLLALDI